jgi:hypothetical protein
MLGAGSSQISHLAKYRKNQSLGAVIIWVTENGADFPQNIFVNYFIFYL